MRFTSWYTDERKRTETRSCANRTAATREEREAATHGWRVDAEEESEGPFSNPGWALGGGFGTFLAGTRDPIQFVVTYVRTDDCLAEHGHTPPPS